MWLKIDQEEDATKHNEGDFLNYFFRNEKVSIIIKNMMG